MPTARLASALAALLIIGLAACTPAAAPDADETATPTPADGGGGGDDIDLCATLTVEEVAAATGADVTVADGMTTGEGQFSCNYNDAEGLAVAGHTYTTTDSAVDPATMYESFSAEGEEISGLGDRAAWTDLGLWVLVDGNLYAINVLSADLDDDAQRQASIDLATIAIGRLP